jgi:hypothetical protein
MSRKIHILSRVLQYLPQKQIRYKNVSSNNILGRSDYLENNRELTHNGFFINKIIVAVGILSCNKILLYLDFYLNTTNKKEYVVYKNIFKNCNTDSWLNVYNKNHEMIDCDFCLVEPRAI